MIIDKWKAKLNPVILLPEGLRGYLTNPQWIVPAHHYDHAQWTIYEELHSRYVPMKYKNERDELGTKILEEDMIDWLYSSSNNIRVLLGEFGDGKSFFLYCLCKQLLADFWKNPQNNYLPIYFSLQDLRSCNSYQTFLRDRLELLKCSISDFIQTKEHFKLLICLDGFDEMSADISPQQIEENAEILMELCNKYFSGTKIIITSRKDCFLNYDIKEWMDQDLAKTELLFLSKIDKKNRQEYLFSGTSLKTDSEKFSILENIMPLLGKAFFLEMTRQLIAENVEGITNEVSIYKKYIEECLKRKRKEGLNHEYKKRINQAKQIESIYHALLTLAIGIQQRGTEYIRKDDFQSLYGLDLVQVLWDNLSFDESDAEESKVLHCSSMNHI